MPDYKDVVRKKQKSVHAFYIQPMFAQLVSPNMLAQDGTNNCFVNWFLDVRCSSILIYGSALMRRKRAWL